MSYIPAGTTQTIPCPSGYYCPTNCSSPFPCSKGSYCPAGVSVPVVCAAGYYCPHLSSQQTQCQAGNYCPSGSEVQLPCMYGKYSNAGASAPSDCKCSILSPNALSSIPTTDGAGCTVTCNDSFIQYQGLCYSYMKMASFDPLTSLLICPRYYSIDGRICTFNITPTCPNGYVNVSNMCIPCPVGQISVNNTCVISDPGYNSILGVEYMCPAGTWSKAGAQVCTLCPRGTFSPTPGAKSSSTCQPCNFNSVSSAGSATCTACQLGTQAQDPSNPDTCKGCVPCPVGYYHPLNTSCLDSTTCLPCTQPTYPNYTTTACGFFTDTVTVATSTCPASQYKTGFSTGSISTNGTPGTECITCAEPINPLNYVSSICYNQYNTVINTASSGACLSSQYMKVIQGSSSQAGSATCINCDNPTGYQYVTGKCTSYANTIFSSCLTSQYILFPGSYSTLASGACTACTDPVDINYAAYIQHRKGNGLLKYAYTDAVCTPNRNTAISYGPSCQTRQGFSAGGIHTLGTAGTCV